MNSCVYAKIPNTTNVAMLNPSALNELIENNCTMPDVKRIIYNLKTCEPACDKDGKKIVENGKTKLKELKNPLLATTVYFVDGTKVTVKNSATDIVETEVKTLENGSEVTVASNGSKERGLMFAVFKRLVTKPDENGTCENGAAGRILRELVENSYDEQYESAKTKMLQEKSKAEYLKKLNSSKPKKKHYSIAETLDRINDVLDKVAAGNATADDAKKAVAELKDKTLKTKKAKNTKKHANATCKIAKNASKKSK